MPEPRGPAGLSAPAAAAAAKDAQQTMRGPAGSANRLNRRLNRRPPARPGRPAAQAPAPPPQPTRAATLGPRPVPAPAPPPPPLQPASPASQPSGGGCCPGGAHGSGLRSGGSGGKHVTPPSAPIGRAGGRAPRLLGNGKPAPCTPRAPTTRALPHLRPPASARRLRQLRTWGRAGSTRGRRPPAPVSGRLRKLRPRLPPGARPPSAAAPEPGCASGVTAAERGPAAQGSQRNARKLRIFRIWERLWAAAMNRAPNPHVPERGAPSPQPQPLRKQSSCLVQCLPRGRRDPSLRTPTLTSCVTLTNYRTTLILNILVGEAGTMIPV